PMVGLVEESESAARAAPGTLPPLPAEEIDLTCLPARPPEELNRHTPEPPLADGPGVIRPVSREVPAAPEEGPELPPPPATLPMLHDAPPPAKLPMLSDEARAAAGDY